MKEALVLLSIDFIERLRTHFTDNYEMEQEEVEEQQQTEGAGSYKTEKVDLSNLIDAIAEDDFFQESMQVVVRETMDGDKETFENLLLRLMNDYKKPAISWLQFLGHFSKRGRLQGYNDIEVSPSKEKI